MKKILLLVGIASYTGASSHDQKLRDAISNLEQELQLTTTESHEEESSFWPQCKIWAGACVIAVVSQFVGFYMLDRRETANMQAMLAQLKAIEECQKQQRADESDHDAPPSAPFGVPKAAGAGNDEKS